MHCRLLSLGLLLALAPASFAQGPIRFARTPDISPDGRTVVFSYLGDLWTVDSAGGVAAPLTMHEAHEYHPAFSPDGQWVAFSSNRMGSYDVFVMPARGGKPKRLTFDSDQEIVTGWTPDGKNITYSSTRGITYPSSLEVYQVPATGGAEVKIPVNEAKDLAIAKDGKRFAMTRGPGTWYRKGYRGSSNDELWIGSFDGSMLYKLTEFNGQDTWPMWSPDGKAIYYVTERFGTPANIVMQELNGESKPVGEPKPITKQQGDGVRKARIAGNGQSIVYECGGDIWITPTQSGQSRKLVIEAYADDKNNTERTITYTKDATEYALSPDEKHVAFVVHGEIFMVPLPAGGKATRLTDSPALDHGVSWSPDGKKMLFLSDRSGREEIYLLEADDPEHPEFTQAHQFKVKALTNTPEPESAATFSPDGKRIVFLRASKLWSMNVDGTDAKTIVDQPAVVDYDWSPDGKWIVYSHQDASWASDLFLIPSTGGQARNLTRYATSNVDVTWSQTGNKIGFLSSRNKTMNAYVMALQKPSAPGTPNSPDFDLDDVHRRVSRISSQEVAHGSISPDGTQFAYRSGTGKDEDLWLASTNGSSTNRLTSGGQAPRLIRWAKKTSGMIFFLNNNGELRAARTALAGIVGTSGPSGEPLKINFSARMVIRDSEEHLEMFDQAWRLMSDMFYDPKYHGANWEAVRAKYRPMVADIGNKQDLYALVSLMLGELNASHLGISGPSRSPEESTAHLGIFFDESFAGPGLKVREIIRRGPNDKRGLKLAPGDVIINIDRTELTADTNISHLLNGKAGELVRVEVIDPAAPKGRRRVELQAVPRPALAPLMYERWVERNAEQVAKESQGKIGYLHIQAMDEPSLERFVRDLYSDNMDKEGIIIDVRNNGGGFTHDQILAYLTGKPHTFFRRRDGGEGLVMRNYDRKWTKPMSVLINNRSYSDAEIFPAAFQTLGLGKVIGQPTGGHVIGTYNTRLIDGSSFRLPRTGVYTLRGINMDKQGVNPDVLVDATPEDFAKGVDPQISKAVAVMKGEIEAWKKANMPLTNQGGNAGSPSGGK